MAAIKEITVDVNAKIVIDKDTADFCLKMVEKYVNDTGALIVVDLREDGITKYTFKEMKKEDGRN